MPLHSHSKEMEKVMRSLVNKLMLAFVVLCIGGCAAVKPACTVIHLADIACETIAVEYVDPATGQKVTVRVKKSDLTTAVKAAASRGDQ